MPLLHLDKQLAGTQPGRVDWFQAFGYRSSGPDRGVHYKNARLAMEPVRQEAGFLVCGLSLGLRDLESGQIVLPFPVAQHLKARVPFRMIIRPEAESRPQMQRFLAWLRAELRTSLQTMDKIIGSTSKNLTP